MAYVAGWFLSWLVGGVRERSQSSRPAGSPPPEQVAKHGRPDGPPAVRALPERLVLGAGDLLVAVRADAHVTVHEVTGRPANHIRSPSGPLGRQRIRLPPCPVHPVDTARYEGLCVVRH